MKLQILQENLEKAVNITTRFTSAKAQLPVLGNILLLARKNKIFVSSTNLEISASVQVGAKIEEEGEISVPGRILGELISNLPKETLNLCTEKEQLKISTGSFSSNVLGMNSSDFPKVPNNIDDKKAVIFNRQEISYSLSKVLFATSTDETRPILTGVLFIFDSKSLSIVATDGFRLSKKDIKIEGINTENKSLVIPKSILGEIGRSSFLGESVYFEFNDNEKQVLFGLDDTVLTSRLLEGEYPDFKKIIPKESLVKITLDREEFARSVKLASIFAREAANIVKIKVLKDSLNIFAESGQAGRQETKVDAKIEKEGIGEFEIAFNCRYLEEFLHSATGEEISMGFTTPTAAGVFRDTSDENYIHLIMPVKI